MGSAASSPETLAHLQEHGWARIPSVLSKEEAASTLSKLWAARDKAAASGEPSHYTWLDPNANNVRVFNLLQLDPIFRTLIGHPTAVGAVQAVLGKDFSISNFTANIARPGSGSMCFHSDQSVVFPEPWDRVWALNIIWCLTDVYADNGATRFVPGSNRWTRREHIPGNAPELLLPFEASAGDVLVMDGTVWHTSGRNVTKDQDRALLFGYYTKSFIRQQINWTATLSKDVQDEVSPEMREWLGLNPVSNIGAVGDLRFMSEQFPEYAEKDAAGS
ncbi:uncharacterized protein K452DRAFT_293868 [Aplosporella prunicola CBS 121167]|uniref:Phytanoyl-CoA dioxygenase family protein n=1 Tax=Aplosporella prunicola CBS 121167 TaxID=1176127 RepID=A0A6A6BTP7_9PEZI|nr:uncharacterized protein K452DRAFT_293868 [Aplosporella prunicola CBS 121167]KAF2147456.1 hypothetical protein K452DRAFT_293868 [Aplosporella prunicola CBS 121167]